MFWPLEKLVPHFVFHRKFAHFLLFETLYNVSFYFLLIIKFFFLILNPDDGNDGRRQCCLGDSPIRCGVGHDRRGGELLRVFNIYGLVSVRTSTQKRGNEQKRKKQHAAAFTNEAKEERKRE
jgi:hypothetical protein